MPQTAPDQYGSGWVSGWLPGGPEPGNGPLPNHTTVTFVVDENGAPL